MIQGGRTVKKVRRRMSSLEDVPADQWGLLEVEDCGDDCLYLLALVDRIRQTMERMRAEKAGVLLALEGLVWHCEGENYAMLSAIIEAFRDGEFGEEPTP